MINWEGGWAKFLKLTPHRIWWGLYLYYTAFLSDYLLNCSLNLLDKLYSHYIIHIHIILLVWDAVLMLGFSIVCHTKMQLALKHALWKMNTVLISYLLNNFLHLKFSLPLTTHDVTQGLLLFLYLVKTCVCQVIW